MYSLKKYDHREFLLGPLQVITVNSCLSASSLTRFSVPCLPSWRYRLWQKEPFVKEPARQLFFPFLYWNCARDYGPAWTNMYLTISKMEHIITHVKWTLVVADIVLSFSRSCLPQLLLDIFISNIWNHSRFLNRSSRLSSCKVCICNKPLRSFWT